MMISPPQVERWGWVKGLRRSGFLNVISEAEKEVYKALTTAQLKYVYFLLAAAGAGIAFAINQTQGSSLRLSQIPLAFGILSWGMSFFFGCRYLQYISSTMYANTELLKAQSGRHPKSGTHLQNMLAVVNGIQQAMDENSIRAGKFAQSQFLCLIAGAVLYVCWHILEMYLRG